MAVLIIKLWISGMRLICQAQYLPFIGNECDGNECDNQPDSIAFSLTDYLKLVDDTGRIIRNDKRGYISESSTKILNRLNIPHDNWLKLTTEFGKLFHGPVGTLQELTDYCEHLEKRRRHFAKCCQHFYSNWQRLISLQKPHPEHIPSFKGWLTSSEIPHFWRN